MKHLGMFLLSKFILMAILIAWMLSRGGSRGGRICRSMYGGCPSTLYILLMQIMRLGSISLGCRVSFCITPLDNLLWIYQIPLVEQFPHMWCDILSPLWGAVPICVVTLCTLILKVQLHWEYNVMIFGSLSIEWLPSLISWWLLILVKCDIAALFWMTSNNFL